MTATRLSWSIHQALVRAGARLTVCSWRASCSWRGVALGLVVLLAGTLVPSPARAQSSPAAGGTGGEICRPDPFTLCLQQERFQVRAFWRTPEGFSGPARMVGLTGESGYFTFFRPENVEGMIKVLDGCGFNRRFWVFTAGLTDVEVSLTVADTWTGQVWSLSNPQKNPYPTVLNTQAFATCMSDSGASGALSVATDRFLPGPDERSGQAGASPAPSPLMPRLVPGRKVLDLAEIGAADRRVGRILGSEGSGLLGLPVAGGLDLDGDGFGDAVMASFLASPLGRDRAGKVYVIFGDGVLGRHLPSWRRGEPIVHIAGGGAQETAGNEVWVDDVTGDGVADLLICRQNFVAPSGQGAPDRVGAGALTVLPGGPRLRRYVHRPTDLDLADLPPELPALTVVGGQHLGRFCIWTRTGDVDGDGIADVVVGADQETHGAATHAGTVYVIRGGPHLAESRTVDLGEWATTALEGNLARILPPADSAEHHFGATCQVADLDGNGRGEVLAATALSRGGAGVPAPGQPSETAHARGGSPAGALHIAWDDNFPPGPWPAGYTVSLAAPPGGRTLLRGGPGNRTFGEEILGGDFDGDGAADLFIGDLTGDLSPFGGLPLSGMGVVIYGAAGLRGLERALDGLPPTLRQTLLLGPEIGAIAGDTAVAGDFDGDGITDLAVSSPHANPPHDSPQSRISAGIVHVLHGESAGWPTLIDLRQPPSTIRLTEIYGAQGERPGDRGDTLGYSMAAGDLDGDGRADLLLNEMLGNGLQVDQGNLLLLSGQSFTTGEPCVADEHTLCLRDGRYRLRAWWQIPRGGRGQAGATPISAETGTFWFFSPSNLEILAKVLDGCPVNDRYWLFTTGLTDVGVQLVVEDTEAGQVRLYINEKSAAFQPILDTQSFATCP